ncbi:MAG: trypsin-like peptidase domain-containing protein [Phycisphaerae bacterium]|nr:trypsin-like peptidase domain-containing protein [Phycisphaerae bacterium]
MAASVLFILVAICPARGEADAPASRPSDPPAPVADLQAIQSAFEALARKAAPSVVTIKAIRAERRAAPSGNGHPSPRQRRTFGAGSGVILRADGLILTNEHVIHDAEEIIIHLNDGKELTASIVQVDQRSDLAVLKVDADGLRAAELGDVTDVRQGHLVFAMGNPFGVASEVGHASMSWGLVSALGRPLPLLGATEDRYYGNLIETTAPINPGNSGGPLFDIHGRVIGIIAAISTRTGRSDGVGFAVPISRRTRRIIEMLKEGQEVEYGLLGTLVRTPDAAERAAAGAPRSLGALVDSVDPGSPAEKVRLRPGDVIIKFDGHEVLDADYLVRMVGSTPPGHTVEMVYCRNKTTKTVEVQLAHRTPASSQEPTPLRWRGLTIAPLTADLTKQLGLSGEAAEKRNGLLIVYVRPDSPADRSGFRTGMVLERIGSQPAPTFAGLQHLIRQLHGQAAEITVVGGKRLKLDPS